jgi:hypothetical protein
VAFLEWEERQEFKYEFGGFEPVATAGVTRAHSILQKNLMIVLGIRRRGKPHDRGPDGNTSGA